uniref:Uncharacterized protein n=1 Tax=Caenorhabditis japonica TaxID=281687 RepID=A0A8R1J331_CAEJA
MCVTDTVKFVFAIGLTFHCTANFYVSDFGLDALAVRLPDGLFTGPIPFTDRVVTSLSPDAEIRKRRVAITRTSSLNLWIRARVVCCQHLRWDSVRNVRSRLMKDGKPDEYATDADSP